MPDAPALSPARLVDCLPQAVFVCDDSGVYLQANPAYERLTGFAQSELLGQAMLARLHHGAVLPAVGEATLWSRALCRHRDGRALPVQLSVTRLPAGADDRHLYLGTAMPEASHDSGQQGPPWHQGFHDAWTQLPNATWLRERIALKLQAARPRGGACTLLALEIDQMVRLRDSLGDERVGEVLQLCGHRLRAVIGPDAPLATLGGGVFACLLEGDTAQADAIVAAVQRAISMPVEGSERPLRLTASLGAVVALPEAPMPEAAELVHRARVALNVARTAGGAQARWFTQAMQAQAQDRLQLEGRLREALEQNQFSLVFQPQLHLASGKVQHMEALLRWECPGVGFIGPQIFIPVAEDLGLIGRIGEWVMREACREVGRLKRLLAARGQPVPRVAVNVSAHQLLDAKLVPMVQSALAEAGLGPESLEIEITESIFLNDAERALATLEELRALGIELAIDDFGTGYSSFSYLTQFPFDRLKIDRSLIMNIDQPGKGHAIVSAIIALAHALGMRVTAEGMETPAQAHALQALHCDDIQGYGFSRPLRPVALEKLLLARPAFAAAERSVA
ncbi:EAL domain-containing protein [Xenophilus arseniciresistens]|uniref:EAL domain-containing protein n=1 Tax=Xenophilus arseniciresistens TaxID=1283306 RepID=A0AAE3SYA9_9BURK|nr:GGDEF domain-containing phosphodiesterase [Xenophilus arseniciresistens]MDA7415907.1 EAL domain-containing protein [Xenophilus arseniciresistens]